MAQLLRGGDVHLSDLEQTEFVKTVTQHISDRSAIEYQSIRIQEMEPS